jgi:3-phenylpropionate/trans-cinnamate dioxygenase ferredoxin component
MMRLARRIPGQRLQPAVPVRRSRTRICHFAAGSYCRAEGHWGFEGGEMAWKRAAGLAELKERRVMDAVIGEEDIALYWVDDAVWATHNICTHAYARLSEGYLDGDCIECPIHQALFDVKTGAAVTAPASTPVKTYPCRIEGDDVLVDV